MKVILYSPDFPRSLQDCGLRATLALSRGLNDMGVAHDVRRARSYKGEIADIAIVNGWTKQFIGFPPFKMNRNAVIQAQAAAGKPAWCIERGYLGDREDYSAFSVGGFCSSGDFRNEGMGPDRWEKLGFKLEPWRKGGDYILLCGQVPWDAQVDHGNHLAWIDAAAREIRKHTERPIRFRQHPKAYRRRDPYKDLSIEFFEIAKASDIDRAPATDFEIEMLGAHAIVCYNSNVATLATVAGIPAFTSAGSMADPIACRDLSKIDDPPTPSRTQWSWNLAHCQWSCEEFRQALPWKHMMR